MSAALVCAGLNLTCADLFTEPGARDVALSLSADSTLVVGSTVAVTAAATAGGAPLTNARFVLTSSDTSIIAVRGNDSLLARARGQADVSVRLVSSLLPGDAPTATRRVSVVVGAVVAESSAVTFESLGDTLRLAAAGLDASGTAVAAPPRWRSTDTARVAIDSVSGRVTARANGAALVIARLDDKADTVAVTVQQVLVRYTFQPTVVFLDALAASQAVVATGRDARNNAIAGVPPVFSVRDPSIALVNAASGTVTSLLNGQTVVRATRGSVVDSIAVTVTQRATSLFIQPAPIPPVTSLGAQVQLSVRAFDRNAVELQGATPAWFTLDPQRVTVTSTGLVTALATGNADIIATLDGVNDTSQVSISNDPAVVRVTPDTATSTSVGDTLIFSAAVTNGAGGAITGGVSWRTPDTAIVRVLADGRTITRTTGFARVIAQAGTRSDTGFVIATNQVAFIDIGPVTRTLTALADVDTPVVTITNARGAPLARSSVGWTSDDAAIARVNAQGHVTAVDTGVVLIRATAGFFTDSVQYTIQNLPTSIAVGGRTIDTLSALGQVLVYPVEVRNRRGALIPNAPVAWTSSDRSVVDTVRNDSAVAIGFGSTLLIAQAAAGVRDTAGLVVANLTRLFVDNAVVVPAGTPRTGTGLRPYARIMDAVSAADANDTVFVRRGLGSYSETVALTKRLVLLGDSGSAAAASTFLGSGRNPSFLPLIAHDTGAAAITAYTTAPQTIRYLAVRHTLDGPALDADGSDVTVEYVYVNPTGSVTTRIGRGISVRNSPSGTGIRRSVIRSVRGYGIRLENVQGAVVFSDSVVGVDSVASVEAGAAIRIVGGGSIIVSTNTLREAQGPLVQATGTAALTVAFNLLYGKQTQVLLDGTLGTGNAVVSNTFDLNSVTGNDNLGSANDGRAGLVFRNSTAGAFVGTNTFQGTVVAGGVNGVMDGIFGDGARGLSINGNTFRGLRYAVRARDLTGTGLNTARADSVTSLLQSEGLDTLTLASDTVRVAASSCINYPGVAGNLNPSSFLVSTSLFESCAATGFAFSSISVAGFPGATPDLTIRQSTVRSKANIRALHFEGGDFRADSNVFVASTVPGDTGRFGLTTGEAVIATNATSVILRGNVIADFRRFTGVLFGATGSMTFGGNRITRNRQGFSYNGSGVVAACGATCAINDVYDNDSLGVRFFGSATFPDSTWWGDARGPRAGGFATGDSVVTCCSLTLTNSDVPRSAGTVASGLRIVRGDGGTALRGSALLPQLTVRVVDVEGRPVAGVSVTFTVTSGGGSFAGPTSVAVVSNGDGLAEANLTLGLSPGVNTVTVTGTSQALGTVTFTATGT